MKLFINFYLVFSILISTTFSNILIAKMFESGSFQKICSYNGDKILLPNGKLIDENKFHDTHIHIRSNSNLRVHRI